MILLSVLLYCKIVTFKSIDISFVFCIVYKRSLIRMIEEDAIVISNNFDRSFYNCNPEWRRTERWLRSSDKFNYGNQSDVTPPIIMENVLQGEFLDTCPWHGFEGRVLRTWKEFFNGLLLFLEREMGRIRHGYCVFSTLFMTSRYRGTLSCRDSLGPSHSGLEKMSVHSWNVKDS